MALIKCPECGKEFSDKAAACPNCAFPVKEILKMSTGDKQESEGMEVVENAKGVEVARSTKGDSNNKMIIIVAIIAAIILIAVLLIVLSKNKSDKGSTELTTETNTENVSKVTYDEAVKLIDSGNYEEAKEKFQTIADYKDVSMILNQIPWETRVFECIEELKDMLKSPDSLKIYSVALFSKEQRDDAKLDQERIDGFKDVFDPEEEAPVIAIHYGGENTMGGMTDQITIFIFDKALHYYVPFGHTKTLDYDKARDEEKDVVFLYNTMNENFNRIGDVDIDRINRIIKNGVYTNVKIIDD